MPTNLDLDAPDPLTPPILTASQNDYGPDGGNRAGTWYLSASSSVNLTGIAGGSANRALTLVNVGAYTITLKAQSSSSAAANRFLTGADITIEAGEALTLRYVAGSSTGWATTDARSTGATLLPAVSAPSAPATGTMALWGQSDGGRVVPMVKGPLSADTMLQPTLARGKVNAWIPTGAGSTATTTVGYNAPTTTGTATGRTCAATSVLTRARRLGYVSSSSAGSFSVFRTNGTQATVGTGTAGVGGFYKLCRFACSDAATVAGARQFVGVIASTSSPSNVEPSTLTNCVGVGHGENDTNLKLFYGGSSAQTPIDLGANFPANTISADLYELILYAPSAASGDVYYQVSRVGTAYVASGTITNTGATVLPAATTFLNYMYSWRCNNATALAVGLDLVSDYIELDV